MISEQETRGMLVDFFNATGCTIEESTEEIRVQLTEEIDKKIMNRPFYWKYIEATHAQGQPAFLTLATTKQDNAIYVHSGSALWQKIVIAIQQLGAYVQMYEKSDASYLTPWLGLNVTVAYLCDRTKEELHALGMNLMTGEVRSNFHAYVLSKELTATAQPHQFCVRPVIAPLKGVERLLQLIERDLEQENHQWAYEATKRWQKEQRMLDFFYENTAGKPDMYYIDKEALQERYKTEITLSVSSGGMFYLNGEG